MTFNREGYENIWLSENYHLLSTEWRSHTFLYFPIPAIVLSTIIFAFLMHLAGWFPFHELASLILSEHVSAVL